MVNPFLFFADHQQLGCCNCWLNKKQGCSSDASSIFQLLHAFFNQMRCLISPACSGSNPASSTCQSSPKYLQRTAPRSNYDQMHEQTHLASSDSTKPVLLSRCQSFLSASRTQHVVLYVERVENTHQLEDKFFSLVRKSG